MDGQFLNTLINLGIVLLIVCAYSAALVAACIIGTKVGEMIEKPLRNRLKGMTRLDVILILFVIVGLAVGHEVMS